MALKPSTPFGRKAPGDAAVRPSMSAGAAATHADPALSPQAQAFLAQLKTQPADQPPDFADWRRAQRPRRFVVVVVGLALLAPGFTSFVFDEPVWLSGLLSVVGMAGNVWLRAERRRRLSGIARWEPAAAPDQP